MLKSRGAAIPYLIWMFLFTVLPLGIIVVYAFTTADGSFTMGNIVAVGDYISVIFRSVWLSAIATAICLLMAYPLAFIISRAKAGNQKMYLTLVMLPMWMNFLLRTYAWMTLLEKTGIINRLLGLLGLGPFNMINTQGAVVLGMVYKNMPFMIIPRYAVMT
ncbi:MAG: ABC transporter permease, partial [Oscillospiraceae bacterium]